MEGQSVRKRTQSRKHRKEKIRRNSNMAWVNIFCVLILCAIIYAIGVFMKF